MARFVSMSVCGIYRRLICNIYCFGKIMELRKMIIQMHSKTCCILLEEILKEIL